MVTVPFEFKPVVVNPDWTIDINTLPHPPLFLSGKPSCLFCRELGVDAAAMFGNRRFTAHMRCAQLHVAGSGDPVADLVPVSVA